jgi:hypothetical protein
MSAQDGLCLCGDGLTVFGEGNCPDDLGAPETLLISLLEDSSGNRIGLDYSVAMNAAYVNGILHNEDPNNAMTIIRRIERFTPEQSDDLTVESSKGTIRKVRDGVVTYEFEFWPDNVNVDAAKWDSFSCLKLQLNVIDTNKNWQGKRGAGTTIVGKEIIPNSFSVRPSPRTLDGISMLIVKFSLDLNSGEKTGVFLKQSDFTDFDLHNDVQQLSNVNCEITGNTLTTVSFKLSRDHGSIASPSTDGLFGMTTSDLQMRNTTDEADVTFSGLVEPTVPDGSYVGTFSAQDSADVVFIDPILNVKLPFRLNNIVNETSILSA